MQYIIIVLSIIIICLFIYYNINKKKIEEKTQKNYLLQHQQELEQQVAEAKQKAATEISELTQQSEQRITEKRADVQRIIDQLQESATHAQKAHDISVKALDDNLSEKCAQVDIKVEAYRTLEMQKAATAIESETEAQQDFAIRGISAYWDMLAELTVDKEQELNAIKEELAEYQKKRQAINDEIMRRRQLDEQQDFYRVCLSNEAVQDIMVLLSIKSRLFHHDRLDELIYDVYVSKAVQEMVKRVLEGREPSGIYKITRLKTGEVYIGKSTNIKKRWTEHCKTAFGNGTIAHSMLHTTMEKDGIEHFTFELLEEVPKDKLTEREKYWINFYDSKTYGLNERNG